MKTNYKYLLSMVFLALLTFAGITMAGFESSIEAPMSMMTSIETPDIDIVHVMSAGVVVSTDVMRSAYARFEAYLMKKFNVPASSLIITQTSLRMEQVITSSASSLTFDPKKGNSNTDRALENKMADNEIFMGVAMSLGIQNVDPAAKDFANNIVLHAPDPNFFTAAGEAASLETMYQGKLDFITESLTRQKDILTNLFRYVGEVQYEAAAGVPPPYAILPKYGPTLEERGFHFLNPNLIFHGDKDNQFKLTFGIGDRAAIEGAGATDNVAVLQYLGYKFSGLANGGANTCS